MEARSKGIENARSHYPETIEVEVLSVTLSASVGERAHPPYRRHQRLRKAATFTCFRLHLVVAECSFRLSPQFLLSFVVGPGVRGGNDGRQDEGLESLAMDAACSDYCTAPVRACRDQPRFRIGAAMNIFRIPAGILGDAGTLLAQLPDRGGVDIARTTPLSLAFSGSAHDCQVRYLQRDLQRTCNGR